MGDTMIETYILRRNIERFRQMLADEPDESNRRTIERMIQEFEGMLSVPEPERRPRKETGDLSTASRRARTCGASKSRLDPSTSGPAYSEQNRWRDLP